MDIQIFDSTLKIKSKKTTLAFDPSEKVSRFDADAVVVTGEPSGISRVNNHRVVINGPGEYEVSGLKITGLKTTGDTMYELTSDSANVLVSKTSTLNSFSADKLGDYSIVILNVDEDLNQSVVTAMEPRVVVLFGEKNKDGAKVLGSENSSQVSKISLSEEKLPEELEVVLLG